MQRFLLVKQVVYTLASVLYCVDAPSNFNAESAIVFVVEENNVIV
jgi:hypothetical protein